MKHAVILAVLIAGVLALTSGKIDGTPYGYDEADYVFAASLGYFANWTDAGTLPMVDFVQLGLRRGGDPGQRSALSQMARSSSDPVVYRHWHGPLYFYWLAAIEPGHPPEWTVRSLSLVFPILTAIVLYFGTLRILPGPAAQPAAMLGAAVLLWGQMTVKTTELAPHMTFVLCYVTALLLAAKLMSGGGRRHWYAAVVIAALAFCTLEVTFVLIATLFICGYLRRRQLAADWRFWRNSAAVLLGTILLVWPPAILKLSFLKAYLFMAYLAVFRPGAWGSMTPAEAWAHHVGRSPIEWLLIAGALVAFFAMRLWRSVPALVPFLLYGLLMVLILARVNGDGPRYITPLFPALLIFASWTAGWLLGRQKTWGWQRYAISAALCLLLFGLTREQMKTRLQHPDPYPPAALAAIRERGLEARTLLVPQLILPTLHYYFPEATLRGYFQTAEIPRVMAADRFDAVLYPDYPVRMEMAAR